MFKVTTVLPKKKSKAERKLERTDTNKNNLLLFCKKVYFYRNIKYP